MPEDLGRYDSSLKGVYFIEGIGLCSNVYGFIDDQQISLIDTGSGVAPNVLTPLLQQLGLDIRNVTRVVITHGHVDHIGGLTGILQHRQPQILMHAKDWEAVEPLGIESVKYLGGGEVVRLGGRDFAVVHTPGHTEGSICLHDGEIILSGDTAFPGGYFGRTDLPSGDSRQLVDSLERLVQLRVRVMLPGHGEPLLSDASSHLKLSRKTAELLRY